MFKPAEVNLKKPVIYGGNMCFSSLKVASVEGFINSVDSQMRQRQEQQKLATISARIDSYEAVEGSSDEVEKVSMIYEPLLYLFI